MFKCLTNIYLPQTETVGTVVHIGAGKCSEQIALKALAPEKIVLVEADQKKVNRLKRVEFWQSDVSIINKLIVSHSDNIDSTENSDFYHANNYKYSTFYKAIEPLKKLLPNIDATVKKQSANSINKLLLDIDVSSQKKNILLLDVFDPDNLLAQAIASDILQQFSLVGILLTDFEEQKDKATRLVTLYEEKGFELAYFDNELNNFQYLYFKKPLVSSVKLEEIEQGIAEQRSKNKALQAQLSTFTAEKEQSEKESLAQYSSLLDEHNKLCQEKESLEIQNAQYEQEKLEAYQKLEVTKAENKALCNKNDQLIASEQSNKTQIVELTNALENNKQECTQAIDESNSRHQQAIKKLDEENEKVNHLQQALTEIKKQNEQLTSEQQTLQSKQVELTKELEESKQFRTRSVEEANRMHEDVKKQLIAEKEDKQQKLTLLETSIDELNKKLANEIKWHQENKNWAESLNKQINGFKEEIAEKTRSVSLGQKMLAKAHIDLDDLRSKYAEKQASEAELVELVKELREKLTLASNYYFKLQQEHPELLIAQEDSKG